MNYTHLGRTGLKVSRLCLGTMNFGDVTDEKTSASILDEALEAGINFIDTADVYGTEQSPDIQQGSGLSEEIIGRWLQQGGRRDRIVLATKAYQPMGPGPNDRRLSAYHIRKACEDSLRRLKTDHIDVYQMHHIDRYTPWEEVWQAMELLVQQGKVLYIGSSNFAGWDIATAQSVATTRHSLGLVAEQSLYNLTARTVELEVIPACRHFGLGLIPWSPLAGGLLGGVLKKMASGRRARPAFARLIEQYRPQLEAYEGLCEDLGETPSCPTARSFLAGAVNPDQRFDSTDRRHNLPRFQPDALAKNMVLLEFAQSWARRKNTTPVQFALAWVMAQRPWIVPIPGTTQYPHLIENSGAPQVRLTDSELREIDAALARIPLQGGRADPFTESQFDKS
ncbi:aldo/keto reductase [Enterobacter bugandensis]|uniref:aldo/keto reductase n=1 Tax=Enterobacter bugandensis TaxID=881260 RepID=UPI00398A66D0